VTIPNLITVARLFIVPVIVWLIVTGRFTAAFWVFVAAGVSDAVDGFIAKHFNAESELGAHLDPVADKALLMSIYITLATVNEIPFWLVVIVVSRDMLIIGGVVLAWMLARPVAMHPLFVSKSNTLAQIVLAAVVLGDLAFPIDMHTARALLVVLTALLTVLSAVAYVVDWLRHMSEIDGSHQGEPTP